MASKRVRVNSLYIYHACGLDRFDGRTGLADGTLVRVINVPGCPKANTMGHCYVGDPNNGDKFIGMVATSSLHSKADYIAYLRGKIEAAEAANPTLLGIQ